MDRLNGEIRSLSLFPFPFLCFWLRVDRFPKYGPRGRFDYSMLVDYPKIHNPDFPNSQSTRDPSKTTE